MRHPYLHPLDHAPGLSQFHRDHLRRVAASICRRTNLHACYNSRLKNVLFHTGDQFGGPLALEAFHPDGSSRHWSDTDIDNAVKYVQLANMPEDRKRAIERRTEWHEQTERNAAKFKRRDNQRPELEKVLGFNDRKRRGVQKVISA